MYVLTRWHQEQGESEVIAVSDSIEKLEARAAEVHADLRLDNEGVTEFLMWSNVGANRVELEAYVDWNWGSDEVYRITPVQVL